MSQSDGCFLSLLFTVDLYYSVYSLREREYILVYIANLATIRGTGIPHSKKIAIPIPTNGIWRNSD